MGSMQKRVRAFTEGAMVMACAVILAVSLEKVGTTSEGNVVPLRGIVSPLAAVTLEAAILPFLFLCLSKLCLADLLCPASKLLLHLSAVLLMALAYVVRLLISMMSLCYFVPLLPLLPFVAWLCYRSFRNGHDHDATVHDDERCEGKLCEEKLETSADFSAAVTALVFLGMEGLALQGQSGSTGVGVPGQGLLEHKTSLFAASLGMSFMTCLAGVLVMLLATVPPLKCSENTEVPPLECSENTEVPDERAKRRDMYCHVMEGSDMYCRVMEVLNAVLAIAVVVIVFLIAIAPMKEYACIMFFPPFISFLVWLFVTICDDDEAQPRIEVKPASLELTKVTFTGFLAVSVPTFSSGSQDNYTHAFILLTGAAVIAGLGWRLLTHGTKRSPAAVTAANIACFCAHLCVAAAVVPFAVMASKALREQ